MLERIHVVNFRGAGRTKFVCGLVWKVFDKNDEGKSLKQKAIENSPTSSFDSLCLIDTTEISNYQLAGYMSGHVPGGISLGALLAEDRDKEQIQLDQFELTDIDGNVFHWLFYARDKVIDFEGDYCGTEDEVRLKIEEIKSEEVGNGLKICHHTAEESIECIESLVIRLIKKNRRKCRLIAVKHNYKKLILGVCLFFGLSMASWYGYEWWGKLRAEREAAELRAARTAEAQAKIKALQKNAYPSVWLKEYEPSDIFNEIIDGFQRIKPSIQCWTWSGAKWIGDKIVVNYQKSNTLAYSKAPGDFSPNKPFSSTLRIPLKFPKKEVRHNKGLMTYEDASEYLAKISLARPYKFVAKWEPVESRTIQEGQFKIKIESAYQCVKFEMSQLMFITNDFVNIFNVPGMVLRSVERKEDGEWIISGTLYVLKNTAQEQPANTRKK